MLNVARFLAFFARPSSGKARVHSQARPVSLFSLPCGGGGRRRLCRCRGSRILWLEWSAGLLVKLSQRLGRYFAFALCISDGAESRVQRAGDVGHLGNTVVADGAHVREVDGYDLGFRLSYARKGLRKRILVLLRLGILLLGFVGLLYLGGYVRASLVDLLHSSGRIRRCSSKVRSWRPAP